MCAGRCRSSTNGNSNSSADGGRFMAELTGTQIDAALESGRIARETEPRAASARYDERSGRIAVELINGCTFAFPPRLAQGLEDGSSDQLAAVEILGEGYGLHWEALDVDLRFRAFWPAYSAPRLIWHEGQGKRHRRRRQQPRVLMVPRAGGRAKRPAARADEKSVRGSSPESRSNLLESVAFIQVDQTRSHRDLGSATRP